MVALIRAATIPWQHTSQLSLCCQLFWQYFAFYVVYWSGQENWILGRRALWQRCHLKLSPTILVMSRNTTMTWSLTWPLKPGCHEMDIIRVCRDETADRDVTDVTQTRKPDYLNISPSNRNDSSANCMYAPPKFLHKGADKTKSPYVNFDSTGSGDI